MKDLYNCCQNVDAKSIALYSGIKIVHVVVRDRKPGVVVQVVPPSKCPPGQSALVQDVPLDSLTRAERSQGTLYPRADCPLLVQNVPTPQ